MGRTDCAKLLSSYGASRSFDIQGINIPMAASEMATHYGHDALAAWFVTSSQWTTPLHHLTIIGATRARAWLRDGADLEAADGAGPTPLSLARALQQAGEAGEDTAAGLVLDAAKPWSQQTHALFPAAARARAVELMLLGHRLSRESVQWGFVGGWRACSRRRCSQHAHPCPPPCPPSTTSPSFWLSWQQTDRQFGRKTHSSPEIASGGKGRGGGRGDGRDYGRGDGSGGLSAVWVWVRLRACKSPTLSDCCSAPRHMCHLHQHLL